MFEKTLIKHLADGHYHSGQWLADQLGVSRTAIWKQLKKLELLGLEIEVIKGRGYRVVGGVELLQRDIILEAVPAGSRALLNLMMYEEIDSTNTRIRALPENERHGAVILAERQTQGRGRRGRNWISPYGRNIYLSMGWQFEGGAASLEGLSLAVGLSVCRALKSVNDELDEKRHELQLKWPNDVLYQGRKLGGVLVEVQGDLSGDCHVTIGIGLNHGMASTAAEMIDQPWADVQEFSTISRNKLAAALIAELVEVLRVFERYGFEAFRDEWSGHDGFKNKPVTLQTVSTSVSGVCRGIARNGALLVETDKGIETFNGGEVSLRVRP